MRIEPLHENRRADRELASTRKTCRNAVAVAFAAVAVLVAVLIWKVVT